MPCLISHTMKSIHDEWARGVPCDLERTDAQLSAALEALPGLLDTAVPSDLERGRQAAGAALGVLDPEDAQPTQDFLAGRLSAIVDLLGYAATQTADPAAIAFARAAPFSDILVLLAKDPLRNTDLAQRLDRDKAQVSKWLAALREAGLVHSHRRGRELYNQLTPLARLIAPASTSTDSEVIS